MTRIDHLLCSDDGSRLLAIQGSLDDPAQRRVAADVDVAASQPAHHSTSTLRADVPDASTPPLAPRTDWTQAHHAMGGH